LHQMATDLGYRLEVVPPVTNDGGVISSTRIRGDILAGELESANGMLKREYELSGKVVPGRKLGQTLGFATANLQPPPEKALPGSGVYASFCLIRGKQYKSITNVGVNPTVSDENPVTVETHALGFSGSLYGEAITVKFVKKLREDQKFTTLENLKMQLEADRALADAFLNLYTNKNR